MPYLSTYVGHEHISDTYWYITGVPELMRVAAERFEKFQQEVRTNHEKIRNDK